VTTSGPEPSHTIVIRDLVAGPIPPHAAQTVWPNVLHTRIADVVGQMGAPPWSKRIIADERQLVTLIASPPGGGNRPHWHREFDEWWVVLAGRLEWELTGGIVIQATKDDIVWVPRGTVHHIRNVGDDLSLRQPRTTSAPASSAAIPMTAHASGARDRAR
jgi:mannose-6-phosphate isomerase-like protein (cupin superfamily)